MLLALCSSVGIMAQVTSVDQLQNGAVVVIYPYGNYGDESLALACSGNGNELTSYGEAGIGKEWTLEYAGTGYFYLKNELGFYWGNQGKDCGKSLECTTNKENAEKVSFTWDSKYNGICFWNEADRIGLNNLNGSNNRYNWWSDPENYDDDSNTTFELMLVSQGDGVVRIKEVEVGGLRFLIDLDAKTGRLLPNDYTGDIVVPHYVNYDGQDYEITSATIGCFKNCTSFDARYINFFSIGGLSSDIKSFAVGDVENIDGGAFSYKSSLQSASFGNVGNIGDRAFDTCSNLRTVTFGNVESIDSYAFAACENLQSAAFGKVGKVGDHAFMYCSSLQSVSFGDLEEIGNNAFWDCGKLHTFVLPATLKKIGSSAFNSNGTKTFKCYVKDPEDLSIDNDFGGCVKEFFVLKSSLEDYKNTIPWNSFAYKILPMADAMVTKIDMPATAVIKTKGKEGRIALKATISPEEAENKTLKWSSSDDGIAAVDDMGNVTGIKAGEADITAAATDGSGVAATCRVTVEPTKISQVAIFGIPAKMNVGEYVNDVKSKVEVYPEDADYISVSIETSNPDVLRYYNTDRLYAKTDGYATITAKVTAFDGTVETASLDVTIGDPSAIAATTADEFSATCRGRLLSVTGVDTDEEIIVGNVAGLTVYKGKKREIVLTAPGVYFVTAKGATKKIYAE